MPALVTSVQWTKINATKKGKGATVFDIFKASGGDRREDAVRKGCHFGSTRGRDKHAALW